MVEINETQDGFEVRTITDSETSVSAFKAIRSSRVVNQCASWF